ncbi:hypothetical protein C5Y41_04105 [Rahnella variigena]|uniref:hypothetical protein n=1 Tax=Rahnella TaxID=34037 RepID=UPI00101C6930|nr:MULTISPECIES: hypothetical protein [Rahnella]RYJ16474.1 hypothetical protein C5Y41_04105 [Rahnella variigena]TCQ89213.1 hypothetical protein EC840_104119 [Rahnella sp. JUb53]
MDFIKNDECDANILQDFEILTKFELYKRALKINHEKELQQVSELIAEIEATFVREGFNALFEDESKCNAVAFFVMQCLQTGDNHEYLAARSFGELSLNINHPFYLDDIISSKAVSIFNKYFQNAKIKLPNRYFWNTLLQENDIPTALEYWLYILDNDNRMKNNLRGSYGNVGVQGNTITNFNQPFNAPREITFTKEKTSSYVIKPKYENIASIGGEINIVTKVALIIDINNGLNDFDDLINEFKEKINLYSSENNITKMNAGFVDDNEIRLPTLSYGQKNIKKNNENTYITNKNSITKFLTGLYCYDLHVFDKMSIVSAAENIINNHTKDNLEYKVETIVKNYHMVRAHIKKLSIDIDKEIK